MGLSSPRLRTRVAWNPARTKHSRLRSIRKDRKTYVRTQNKTASHEEQKRRKDGRSCADNHRHPPKLPYTRLDCEKTRPREKDGRHRNALKNRERRAESTWGGGTELLGSLVVNLGNCSEGLDAVSTGNEICGHMGTYLAFFVRSFVSLITF